MNLKLDFTSIGSSVSELRDLARNAFESSQTASLSEINGAYSAVTGLSHMGNNHGQFVSAGTGSAVDVLRLYVQHIDWLQANLDSNAHALGLQESTNSRGVELADGGGVAVSDTVQSIERPSANFNGFTFFKPVSLPMDIHSLAASLRASQDAQPVAAGKQWISLATQIAQVAIGLRKVTSQISASNEGAVFDAMIPRFEEVASWGDNFAINASQVAADLGRLSLEKLAIQVEAEAVAAQALAINEPQARIAFESYQALMMHEKLQQGLSRAMPTVSNLMSVPTVSTSVQQAIQTGIDALNGNQQVSGNGLGATGQVIGQVANMVTGAGNFGAVDRGVGADGVPTQAASVATAPTATGAGVGGALPNVSGTGSGVSGVSGSPTSAAGFGGVNSPSVMGAAGSAANFAGAAGASAMGQGARAAGMGMVPGMGAAGAAGNGARGATSGVGGSGVGGRVSPGITGGYAGANTAGAGAGRAGMGAMPFAGGAPVAATGMASGGAGAGAGAGAGSGVRGGAPMMGGMPVGAQGNQARGKVRRVSSSLEEDHNVKALLGDRGAVVPGVIGAWVRD